MSAYPLESSADPYAAVMEPDVVLPSQFYSGKMTGLIGGERKLMAAVLSDGIQAYISNCVANPDSEAIDWVERDDTGYIFSFESVCEALGINPNYLRAGLRRYAISMRNEVGSRAVEWKRIRRPRK